MTSMSAPAEPTGSAVSFPRLSARTARFTLGAPRNITVTESGARVLFVRTGSGTDRTGQLWCFDVADRSERLLADPTVLLAGQGEQLSAAERSRRERARESGAGITSYSLDSSGAAAVFVLSGQLWVCDVASGACRVLPTEHPVIDPRIDPTGRRVAYASDGALRVVPVDGSEADRALATPDAADVVWGQAEFVAGEEMERYRGFWWSPDGDSLLVERYDNAPVQTWHIADPANPATPPVVHRYPAAGTPNASVGLWHVTLDSAKRPIDWDSGTYPYLSGVRWTSGGAVMQVLSRDQRRGEIRRIDVSPAGVVTTLLASPADDHWIDIFSSLPVLTSTGKLLTVAPDYGERPTNRITVDGAPISPVGSQVRRVLDVGDQGVLAVVSTDPREYRLVTLGYDGAVTDHGPEGGVCSGAVGGETMVVVATALDAVDSTYSVLVGGEEIARLHSRAQRPPLEPAAHMHRVGDRDLCAAVVFPRGYEPRGDGAGAAMLPVIMAPYGGPHGQQVAYSGRMYLQAQWLADQGFAVIVADGRGTPGRGPVWDREVADEFAAVTLQDQVDALDGVAQLYPGDIDTARVGIMGWSYGGYLSALAVLERPDRFHAAVAGAPPTDWTLYDTCYTERYLGHPDVSPEVYRRNSLIGRASQLRRPLLLVHGLADDNVVAAHTLRLSSALLAAGRAHQVLPLTGITHMTSDEVVAENLLTAQVEFLRAHLR